MQKIINFIVRKEGRAWQDLSALLLLFGTVFFQFLGRLPLLEPDEGRYAEIPREMLERMDFVTPYLNYVKYFEKPPLLYWLNAVSFSVFGQNEFAARFFATLSGLLGVLLVYFIGRKIFGRREGLIAALVLGTSVGYLAQSRMNIIDMLLTFCMTATLGFFLLAVQAEERRKALYFHLFYLFAALAVLAKGLIGLVLPGAVIFLYIVCTRQWRIVRDMRLSTGVPLFLLVVTPWFVLVSLRNPEFARFFFIHEHFQRFLTKIHHHYQPVWYFVPVLLGCMFPWSLFLPLTARRLWREKSSGKGSAVLFLVLWAIVIFGFFSLSSSKLMPYILPVFPAVALLVARAFSSVMEEGCKPFGAELYGAALFVTLSGLGALLYFWLAPRPKLEFITVVLLGSFLIFGGVSALLCLRKKSLVAYFACLCVMSCLVSLAGPPLIFGKLAERKATPELARLIREEYRDGDRIASYGWYQEGLPFYTSQRVIVVGDKGELEFGSKQGDNGAWFIEPAAFRRLWDEPVRVFTLIKGSDLERLRGEVRTPVQVLGQKGDKFLIRNR